MTDSPQPITPVHHSADMSDDKTLPIIVYVLFLLGFATGFLTTIAGVIIAYGQKRRCGDVARSHYVFLLRTAWIGLCWALATGVLALAAALLVVVLIGLAIFPLVWASGALLAIWFTARLVVGLIFASRNEAYPRPCAWLI